MEELKHQLTLHQGEIHTLGQRMTKVEGDVVNVKQAQESAKELNNVQFRALSDKYDNLFEFVKEFKRDFDAKIFRVMTFLIVIFGGGVAALIVYIWLESKGLGH